MQSPRRPRPHRDAGKEFGDLLETTSALRTSAGRLALESPGGWTPASTRTLSAFSDRLVASLLPNLAAMESVICPHLDAGLKGTLEADHRDLRRLAERIAMVSEAISRSRRPRSEVARAGVELRAVGVALEALRDHQLCAVSRLAGTPAAGRIAESFEGAVREARERIVLITQPEVPARESSVLRRRPDLDRADATTLATALKGVSAG